MTAAKITVAMQNARIVFSPRRRFRQRPVPMYEFNAGWNRKKRSSLGAKISGRSLPRKMLKLGNKVGLIEVPAVRCQPRVLASQRLHSRQRLPEPQHPGKKLRRHSRLLKAH